MNVEVSIVGVYATVFTFLLLVMQRQSENLWDKFDQEISSYSPNEGAMVKVAREGYREPNRLIQAYAALCWLGLFLCLLWFLWLLTGWPSHGHGTTGLTVYLLVLVAVFVYYQGKVAYKEWIGPHDDSG